MKRKLTATARAKMSAAATAQMADTTARTRLSEANRGENNPMFGRKLSEATRVHLDIITFGALVVVVIDWLMPDLN